MAGTESVGLSRKLPWNCYKNKYTPRRSNVVGPSSTHHLSRAVATPQPTLPLPSSARRRRAGHRRLSDRQRPGVVLAAAWSVARGGARRGPVDGGRGAPGGLQRVAGSSSFCRRDPRHPSHGRLRTVSRSSNESGTGSGFPRGTFSSDGDDRKSKGSKAGYYLDTRCHGL